MSLRSLLPLAACLLLAARAAPARPPATRLYVVTPAPRRLQIDSAPSRGVSYSGGRRRSDDLPAAPNPRPATPDLIFAEFEADGGRKSVRRLLDRERINPSMASATTAPSPSTANSSDLIFAEFEAGSNREKSIKSLLSKEKNIGNFGAPIMSLPPFSDISHSENHRDEYHAVYNPIFETKLPARTPAPPSVARTTTTTEAAEEQTTLAPMKVEDIWHVISNERAQAQVKEVGRWEQVVLPTAPPLYPSTVDDNEEDTEPATTPPTTLDDPYIHNFVYPGFSSDDEKSSENESRAIRTESNIRFPYVNLKTYQMKNRPPQKKGNELYTSVDKFRDEKNPLRGEAQDAGPPVRSQVDRYNPAQPHLPPPPYGSASKQSAPSKPSKTVANLIPPPPPPPPPRASAGDFPPPPDTYESFPPYAPPPRPPAPPSRPALSYRPPPPAPPPPPPSYISGPQAGDDDSAPPSPTSSSDGYDYRPPSSGDGGPDYGPPGPGYSYGGPRPPLAPPPEDPEPPPAPPAAAPPSSGYKPHDYPTHDYPPHAPAPDAPDADYPELVYSKPHMPKPPPMMDGGDMVKGVEMMPPPPPGGGGGDDAPGDFPNLMFDGAPPDDHGFKYHHHHDFEDYDHHHHHHHPTTTTTTTTEMPRVNRFSYYYLGKKLYYLPLYFSVYFVVYVGALIIKAVLRHKIVYPNSWSAPPAGQGGLLRRRRTAADPLPAPHLHELTRRVTNALVAAADKYSGTSNDS